MRAHSISSSEKSRSVADTHKGDGASLPAAQLYYNGILNYVNHRISDNGDMAVRDSGKPNHFFAKGNANLAPHVLAANGNGPNGTTKYRAAINYDNDCGAYASALLREMYQLNTNTHSGYKRTVNATQNAEVPSMNYINFLWNRQIAAPAQPTLGQVYLAINKPTDPEIATGGHYNFHWATVVAQDGNDVITCEAAPHEDYAWFQMYNEARPGQTFKQEYVTTLDKLHDDAKVFALTYHARPQQPVFGGVIE